jgi:hypothetical protein
MRRERGPNFGQQLDLQARTARGTSDPAGERAGRLVLALNVTIVFLAPLLGRSSWIGYAVLR